MEEQTLVRYLCSVHTVEHYNYGRTVPSILLDLSTSYKAVEEPSTVKELDRVELRYVLNKKPPALNLGSDSASSVFSSEDGEHTQAQPYETPLVTSFSSRLNFFPSISTLDTVTGSEINRSQTYAGTTTQEKLATKPKPAAKTPLSDGEGSRFLMDKSPKLASESKCTHQEKLRKEKHKV